MEPVSAPAILPDINHAASDESAAKNADALVVERLPPAMSVALAKSAEFTIEGDVFVHQGKKSRNKPARQSGGERNLVWGIFLGFSGTSGERSG